MGENIRNVFWWLDQVRQRPGMYIGHHSLDQLQYLIWGYCSALAINGVVEPGPSMSHFHEWVSHRMRCSTRDGWGAAIAEPHPDPVRAFAAFYKLVDEFRKLRSTTLSAVWLSARHNPTGKRVHLGSGLAEKPRRIDVIRYRPGPFQFLRFYYPDGRISNDGFLRKDDGSFATAIRFAKEWVRDEFQVEFSAWKQT